MQDDDNVEGAGVYSLLLWGTRVVERLGGSATIRHIVQGRVGKRGKGVIGNVFDDCIRPLGQDVTGHESGNDCLRER